jgi:hypothetical protein
VACMMRVYSSSSNHAREQLHRPAYDMCGSSCRARWKSRTAASCSRCRLKQLPATHLHTRTTSLGVMPPQSEGGSCGG